jgi:NAD(P)-dependent dehydrogenase (short-subunit alcohol dehydrogenase family)
MGTKEENAMQDVAIVTGHGSGLGQAFADRLLARGFLVVGVSRRPAGSPEPAGLSSIQGSVADQATVDRAFDTAESLGQLRMVVNCAGRGVFGEIGSYSVAEIGSALEANLLGLIAFTDHAIRSMRQSGGDIVNIMSTASKKLRTAESVYTAAKWGAKAYTRTVRDAIKGAKLPIRVFEVYPCGMKTRFWIDAVRPVSDGAAFPAPGPIADAVLNAILAKADSYPQELTFERS